MSILTADVNLLGGLHGNAVAVVRIARDMLHVGGHIMNGGDHVS